MQSCVMAELGGQAVRRLLFLGATSRGGLSGVQNQFVRRYVWTEPQGATLDVPFYRKPWRIFVAVLLERKPIISRDLAELEKKFLAYQNDLEFEQSVFSNHEVKKMKLMKGSMTTKKKKNTEAEEQKRLECEQELSKMEDEQEEISEQLNNLQLGSRTSIEDEYALNRHLDRNLHLVVKRSDRWMLPETEIVSGESLRQAAERLITSELSTEVKALFLSNAPSGVCTEKIDSSKRSESEVQGRKIFYYKAKLQRENNSYPDLGADSKWLTLSEMQKALPKEHFKQIIKFSS